MTPHTRLHPGLGRIALAASAVLAVPLVAACAEEAAAIAELHVVAGGGDHSAEGHEYQFELPDDVAAGPTRVSLANEGTEAHHAQLFRLENGATVEELTAALADGGPPAALEVGAYVGGTALVAPGETSHAEAVVDLEPGNYVFLCLVEAPDGKPHVAHGMLHPFTVDENADVPPAPDADISVDLVDYDFELPDTIDGDALLEVTNAAAAEPHEMEVARLDDGATIDDVARALEAGTAVPATPVGGMQAILPGATQHVQFDLEPGRYVVVCEVPSPDGTPHHAKGMIQEVTVT